MREVAAASAAVAKRPMIVSAMVIAALMAGTPAAHAETCWLVRTVSNKVYCKVHIEDVACFTAGGFSNAPAPQYQYLPIATSAGTFSWVNAGGLGTCPNDPQTLTYGVTQNIKGWTIQPDASGTRFLNAYGQVMFVSIQNVYPI